MKHEWKDTGSTAEKIYEPDESYEACMLCNDFDADVSIVVEGVNDQPNLFCYNCLGILRKVADG